jgi:peptidoglycan/LPS O-acetylase OafA/YrhL
MAVFVAHAVGATTAHWPASAALGGLNAFLLASLNIGFTLGFTLAGFELAEYLRTTERTAGSLLADVRAAVRWLGPLYALCLLIGFGVEPIIAAIRGLPYTEPARLTYYLFGLPNFDKLRIQPTSWVLAELWAVAAVGQWLLSGGLLLWLAPRRWWRAILIVILIASVGFQARHPHETLLLKLHSGAIFTDFAIGGLVALAVNGRFWRRLLSSRQSLLLMRFAAIIGLVGLVFVQRSWLAHPQLAPFYRGIVSVACGGLILTACLDDSPMTLPNVGRWLAWLGQHAYAAYGLHTAAIGLATFLLTPLAPRFTWLLIPLALAFTVGAAALFHRLAAPISPPPDTRPA